MYRAAPDFATWEFSTSLCYGATTDALYHGGAAFSHDSIKSMFPKRYMVQISYWND